MRTSPLFFVRTLSFKKIIKSKLFSYWDLGPCKNVIPINGRKPLEETNLYKQGDTDSVAPK